MSVISSPALFMGEDGYQISRSVRLRSSASAYFNRTLTTPTSNTTWTFSCWLKRGAIGSTGGLFAESTGYAGIYFSSDKIRVMDNAGGVALETTAVYRDPSAWAHLIIRSNGTNIKAYWNSVEVGSYTGTITLLNAATSHHLGRYSSAYFDGYLTEVNFIDGQALTPSSFGENDSITGVWKPKKYAGTYGTNGFYLNFSDNSNNTAATIGKDYSGNGNNWTPNNISVTTGSTYDSMLDTPTPYADGGNGRGNYATWNAVANTGGMALANGNLNAASSSVSRGIGSTIAFPSSGKYYAEITVNALATNGNLGICSVQDTNLPSGNLTGSSTALVYHNNGNKYVNGTSSAYGASYTNGDVIGIAVDVDGGTVTFYKNNASQGAITYATAGLNYVWFAYVYNGNVDFNAGQRPFAYTPPTGFKALNTQNLPDSTIKKGNAYFDVHTRSGTGSSTSITGKAFQPDLVWVKSRSAGTKHLLTDSVRGATKRLSDGTTTDGTDPEATDTNGLTAFNSDGYTIGSDTNYNNSTGPATYVDWLWKAGQGTTSSNTSGSITSTVSVNATAGFSVVTYTGTGSSGTVGHGLGVTPSMIILKKRSGVQSWFVNHTSISATQNLYLNATDSVQSDNVFSSRSSTTFGLGSNGSDSSANYVAYCWAAVAGYSAFGSYTGNGSTDGTFVHLGFRPRYVLIKCSSNGGAGYDWFIHDTSRDTYNQCDNDLEANQSLSENQYGAQLDILSNGFKLRNTGAGTNGSSTTYIYAAFAENPFKLALAR